MVNGKREVLKFVDGAVPINVHKNGEPVVVTVPARQHPMAPGMAVTMLNFGVFCVTHLPTGMAMDFGSEREGTAALRMASFAAIAKAYGFSWADIQSVAEGSAKLKGLKDHPVPFEGATVTSGGTTTPMTIGEWYQCLRMTRMVSDEFPWEAPSERPLDQAVNLLESLRDG